MEFISLNIAWHIFSLRLCDYGIFVFAPTTFLKIAWQICHANMLSGYRLSSTVWVLAHAIPLSSTKVAAVLQDGGQGWVCLMCEPASHVSHSASHASHASHGFNVKEY